MASLSKSFEADFTLIRFLTSVYTVMYLQLVSLYESFTTDVTLVRFLPSVYAVMYL